MPGLEKGTCTGIWKNHRQRVSFILTRDAVLLYKMLATGRLLLRSHVPSSQNMGKKD